MPVLLRQTSFKALEEPVLFAGNIKAPAPRALVKIEQRGVALTPKGRELYDGFARRVRHRQKTT